VPVDEEIQAALERRLGELDDGRGSLAAGVERDERLARLAVADELEPPEQSQPAHVADRRMPLLQRAQLLREICAVRRGVLDDSLLAERLDRRNRGSAREWVAAVRQAARERLVAH